MPLISSVDTGLMGGLSALHIGSVGLGSMIFNFLYWNFGFLRMGTTGMTAQAYGKKDKTAIVHTCGRALLVAIVISTLMILLQYPLGNLGFALMNVSDSQYELVSEYFYIRIWAAPATLVLIVMMGWFFGMQNAIYPLLLTILINISNIIVSYTMVMYYDMGVAGVAWGTVIAQYLGAFTALLMFLLKYKKLLQHFKRKLLFSSREFIGFLKINTDIFLRTFCLTIAFGFFYSKSASAGTAILAVNTILMQFLNWMSFGVDGFAYAAESMVGKYKGAGNKEATRKSIQVAMFWGMGLAFTYSIIYGFFGESIVHLFTDKASVRTAALPYLWWMILLPVIGSPCYIWDGVFIGLTAVKSMRNSMAAALTIYMLCYYILINIYPAEEMLSDILWTSLLGFLATRGLLMWGYYRKFGLSIR